MWWSCVHRVHRVVIPFFSQRTMSWQPVLTGEKRRRYPTHGAKYYIYLLDPTYINWFAHAQWLARLALAARSARSAVATAVIGRVKQICFSNLSGKSILWSSGFFSEILLIQQVSSGIAVTADIGFVFFSCECLHRKRTASAQRCCVFHRTARVSPANRTRQSVKRT